MCFSIVAVVGLLVSVSAACISGNRCDLGVAFCCCSPCACSVGRNGWRFEHAFGSFGSMVVHGLGIGLCLFAFGHSALNLLTDSAS